MELRTDVTGYLVSATGNFTIPFIVCGVLALLGTIPALFGARAPIGAAARSAPVGQAAGVV